MHWMQDPEMRKCIRVFLSVDDMLQATLHASPDDPKLAGGILVLMPAQKIGNFILRVRQSRRGLISMYGPRELKLINNLYFAFHHPSYDSSQRLTWRTFSCVWSMFNPYTIEKPDSELIRLSILKHAEVPE